MCKAGLCLLFLMAASAAAAYETGPLAEANAAFALDLYGELGESPGNVALAPLNVSTVLAMTLAGAGEETAAQMARVLHVDDTGEDVHASYASLREDLQDMEDCSLSRAAAIWGQSGESIREDYLALAAESYAAGFHEVNFQGETERARRTINAWTEAETGERIRELLRSGDLDGETVLVLTGTVWFKGNWAHRFDPRYTKVGPFRTGTGQQATVPFMHQTGTFLHAADGDLQILDLPYKGGRLSMTILLPGRTGGVRGLESSLTRERLDSWLGLLRKETVRVAMPRFRLESSFDLSHALKALGMIDAFDDLRADFSGINGRKNLFVSMVAHGAFIETDEEGTEAAGGTAVVIQKRGGTPPEFRADRPFLFLIRDRETGSILFLGRVSDPSKS